MSFRIELRNSAGILDVRIVDTEEETRAAVLELATEMAFFADGDSIHIFEMVQA